MFDIVTVVHNARNTALAADMLKQLKTYADAPYQAVIVDNSIVNRGFAPACNIGAGEGGAPIIGFLNPDAQITGSFLRELATVFEEPFVVIAGCRFAKPQLEVQAWGLKHWVCGAAMFVRRSWWADQGGFDERFKFGFEETDLCRRAEAQNLKIRELHLPILHSSPMDDSPQDEAYKTTWLNRGWHIYRQKWGLPA